MAARNLPEMPCGPLLELHGQRKRFHVPYGLQHLLEEMSRDILRDQPEDIYGYLACFMEARVQRKAAEQAIKSSRKSWQVHRWSFEASSVLSAHTLEEFLQTLKPSIEDATRCAIIIQKTYRGHHARIVVEEIRKSREIDVVKLHKIIDENVAEFVKGETEGGFDDEEPPTLTQEIQKEPDEIQHLPEETTTTESEKHEKGHQEKENESDFDSQTYELEENELNEYRTETEEEEESVVDSLPSYHSEENHGDDEVIMLKAPPSIIAQVESKVDDSPDPPTIVADGQINE